MDLFLELSKYEIFSLLNGAPELPFMCIVTLLTSKMLMHWDMVHTFICIIKNTY